MVVVKGKKAKVQVSIKAKKAIKDLVENGGSVSAAMRRAGYSPKTAKTPKKLTESRAYKELMEEILPDKFLTEKHKELLSVPMKRRTYIKGEFESEETSLDVQAISKGLDMAYKIKGHYAPEKKEISGNLSLTELFNESQNDDEEDNDES